MDENSFVNNLRSEFPFKYGVGIGDDTAIIEKGDGFLLITKDILIEGIHFDLAYFTPEEIAVKALGVNLSDIAAMGGTPEYFFLGLGFPNSFKGEKIDRFFVELKRSSSKWDVELAGGDLSSSPDKLFISITMVGSSPDPVRRDRAEEGDLIGISRATGESALGFELLKQGISMPYYSEKHKVPDPEVAKGKAFSKYVNSMIDISDGLLIDLGRIMTASEKMGVVEYGKIPVSDDLKAVCKKYDFSESELVLAGGEDFSLLFTVSPEKEKELKRTGIEYQIIGKVVAGEGVRIEHHGKPLSPGRVGFDHFK